MPVSIKIEEGVDYYASASDTEELKVEDNAHPGRNEAPDSGAEPSDGPVQDLRSANAGDSHPRVLMSDKSLPATTKKV